MELLKSLVHECVMDLSIADFRGSLSVSWEGEGKGKFSIWVMKQYGVAESWSKQFIIDSQGRWSTPLGLSKSGEILLATSNEEVVSYHPETQQVMDVAIRGSEVLFYLGNYVESLVLVSGVLRREEESCGEGSKNGGLSKKRKNRQVTLSRLSFTILSKNGGLWKKRKNRAVAGGKGQH